MKTLGDFVYLEVILLRLCGWLAMIAFVTGMVILLRKQWPDDEANTGPAARKQTGGTSDS